MPGQTFGLIQKKHIKAQNDMLLIPATKTFHNFHLENLNWDN